MYFLSCLPETIRESDIERHFSKFGTVVRIKLAKMKDGSCKGYCKLSFKPKRNLGHRLGLEMSDHKALLRFNHIISGNPIQIEEFLDKKTNLAQKDQTLIKCRVCILNIPSSNFTDQNLSDSFSKYFGKLRGAYVRDNKHLK